MNKAINSDKLLEWIDDRIFFYNNLIKEEEDGGGQGSEHWASYHQSKNILESVKLNILAESQSVPQTEKTFEQCCQEVAGKHKLGSTLVMGHKKSYYVEAVEIYSKQLLEKQEGSVRLLKELYGLKRMKDSFGKIPAYQENQPKVWEAVKEFLNNK